MNNTIKYYDINAKEFVETTKSVDFSALQKDFMSRVKKGGHIVDLGCGSGRDSKAFLENGYSVEAIDGSQELCKLASEYVGMPVKCITFQDYIPSQNADGIWACASLLHIKYDEIKDVVETLSRYLNNNGCFYMSFKYGNAECERNGRFFTDMNEERIKNLLNGTSLEINDIFISYDVRPGREKEKWINVFANKRQTNNKISQ